MKLTARKHVEAILREKVRRKGVQTDEAMQ